MEDTIYVKNIKQKGNDINMLVSIYDKTLPEFTLGSTAILSTDIDSKTGSLIEVVEWTDKQIPRPEIEKNFTVPYNYPLEHIEDLVKEEKKKYIEQQNLLQEKLNYFSGKTY